MILSLNKYIYICIVISSHIGPMYIVTSCINEKVRSYRYEDSDSKAVYLKAKINRFISLGSGDKFIDK